MQAGGRPAHRRHATALHPPAGRVACVGDGRCAAQGRGRHARTRWIVIAVVVIVVIAAAVVIAQRRRSQGLRERFGPEYDRTAQEMGSPRRAEVELARRENRYRSLDIRPLTPGARDRYAESWRAVQAKFVDDPGAAVTDADRLVNEVMRDRGYPVDDTAHRWTISPSSTRACSTTTAPLPQSHSAMRVARRRPKKCARRWFRTARCSTICSAPIPCRAEPSKAASSNRPRRGRTGSTLMNDRANLGTDDDRRSADHDCDRRPAHPDRTRRCRGRRGAGAEHGRRRRGTAPERRTQ